MFIKSIRWRLQLWLAFLLVAILSGFGVTAYQLHRTNRFGQIDEELERRVAALGADVRGPPPFGRPLGRPPTGGGPELPPLEFRGPEPRGDDPHGFRNRPDPDFDARQIRLSTRTLSLFEPGETNGYYFAIWSRSGLLLKAATNAPAELSRPRRQAEDTRLLARLRGQRREVYQYSGIGECLLAGRDITNDLRALDRFAGWLVVAGMAVLALGLGGGWLLASHAIRPVDAISSAATRISAGHLAERIQVAETDSELGRLARVLNATFARLEAAFAQQKQFTADASHELRTPLAVLISEAQGALARERTGPEYRETIETCLGAAQQMRRLAQSLLELARFDAGQEPLDRSALDLAERARTCLDQIRPLAEQRGLRLEHDLEPAPTQGDPDRIDQVLMNLLSNAVWYNRDQGTIRVTTRREGEMSVLRVADTGLGISDGDLPHVFERFFRGDKARGRAEGRSGLGLAISKAIVELHGGRIDVSSTPGAGSIFTVRLPT